MTHVCYLVKFCVIAYVINTNGQVIFAKLVETEVVILFLVRGLVRIKLIMPSTINVSSIVTKPNIVTKSSKLDR